MKVRYGERLLPYPLHAISGKLLLSGLQESSVVNFISKLKQEYFNTSPTIQELNIFATEYLLGENPEIQGKFLTLTRYDELSKRASSTPPIILVIEGSSATGKSMLTLPIIERLSVTRILSTDSIRQVLRTQYNKDQYPELFCHTYQAHRFRQVGSEDLDVVVRGFLAQIDLMKKTLNTSIERYIMEGTSAIIEGVHIIPGFLQSLGTSIIEILIHPSYELHQAMFTLKQEASGLKTVSGEADIREAEFRDTRKIQEYMYHCATMNGIPVIDFEDYESALASIQELIVDRIQSIVDFHS